MSNEEHPRLNPNTTWRVNYLTRVSAKYKRPGLAKMYVTVLDGKGQSAPGVKVRFDTEPSVGIIYAHLNVWGLTNERGYVEWRHLGRQSPTRYRMFMEEDEIALIENIRTDLGNEYLIDPRTGKIIRYIPVNRPGVYSYRIEVAHKSE